MITKTDKDFIELSNSLAEAWLKKGGYPCVCIIIKNGKIISKAKSKETNKYDATAHAEIIAISRACRKLKTKTLRNCTLYTNIEPCLMCAKAIVYSKINRVVYGTAHKEYGNRKTFDILKQNDIGKGIKVISGLEREKAKKLLDKYNEK